MLSFWYHRLIVAHVQILTLCHAHLLLLNTGKTNVALLTVVAHFRDVGLLPQDKGEYGYDEESIRNVVDAGGKVIYIAPMKALAQEVVEKFSDKLKPLRLSVRELTGDMQLTRAEAESADVIVTVRVGIEGPRETIV